VFDTAADNAMTETERRRSARRRLWLQALPAEAISGNVVLDAGTGEGWFTRYLAEQRPRRLVSITCRQAEIVSARRQLGELADAVEFVVADLTQMREIPANSFDVVAGDYLIAAVSASRPFREIDLLKELLRVLRVGGTMALTGWEATPSRDSPTEGKVRRLYRLREAIQHLLGMRPFREHPEFWVTDRLRELGMNIRRCCSITDVHHDLRWLAQQIGDLLERLADMELRNILDARRAALIEELGRDPAFGMGVEFGRHYAVIAAKPPLGFPPSIIRRDGF
jgi:ubiquinone/menaquinone biosynthesis C-methylase UbiE